MMPGATMNTGLKSLKECFGELRDPRIMGRTTHALLDILVLTICAVIAGAHDWEYVELWGAERIDFLRQFVPLENGIPSHDTIGRVFAALDSKGSRLALRAGYQRSVCLWQARW